MLASSFGSIKMQGPSQLTQSTLSCSSIFSAKILSIHNSFVGIFFLHTPKIRKLITVVNGLLKLFYELKQMNKKQLNKSALKSKCLNCWSMKTYDKIVIIAVRSPWDWLKNCFLNFLPFELVSHINSCLLNISMLRYLKCKV